MRMIVNASLDHTAGVSLYNIAVIVSNCSYHIHLALSEFYLH